MNFLRNIYSKKLLYNKQQIEYWEDYLNKLKTLEFSIFSKKLKIPALIPLGNKILFRGELIHTNEVIVALGADYFVKCSTKQADILRKHRISDAESKLILLLKEKEYLDNQILLNDNETNGQEIIEPYKEQDETIWRQKHKENLRKHVQCRNKSFTEIDTSTDAQLWERLDELELEEDLKNELVQHSTRTNLIKNMSNYKTEAREVSTLNKAKKITHCDYQANINIVNDCDSNIQNLLKRALVKQEEIEIKLHELRNRGKNVSKTESDVISRMNELEELDELEDEINRLDDVLNSNTPENANLINDRPKERVSFIDDEDNQTLELTFSHSNNEPDPQPYDPKTGITKPSDFYEAFKIADEQKQTISILKKKNNHVINQSDIKVSNSNATNNSQLTNDERSTIVINDVTEKNKTNININETENIVRPPSLFKMKRLNNMSK